MAYSPTVRQRALLRSHALMNADLAYDDIEERGDAHVTTGSWWYVFDRLPSSTFRQPVRWRRQMARAFRDVADDLDHGGVIAPRSLAEYSATLLTIDDAFRAYISNDYDDNITSLPGDVNDFDWASLTEAVVLDPELGTLAICSVIDQLSPDAWFKVTSGSQPRDPDRGFARS